LHNKAGEIVAEKVKQSITQIVTPNRKILTPCLVEDVISDQSIYELEMICETLKKNDGKTIAAYLSGNPSMQKIARSEIDALNKYELFRNMSSDIEQISKHTQLPKSIIEKIKDHLFKNEHIILERYSTVEIIKKFDPDIDIALTWERLCENTYVDSDLEFLKHEYLESLLMGKCEVEYFEAHDLVNCIFDWFQNVKE
jgi:hypothetical protein